MSSAENERNGFHSPAVDAPSLCISLARQQAAPGIANSTSATDNGGGGGGVAVGGDSVVLYGDEAAAGVQPRCSPPETADPDGRDFLYEPWQAVLVAITCAAIVCGTILGNVLVCTAVAIVRKLQTPSNLLIVSLAVSDLLVALLVMPPATAYELMGRWALGRAVCDAWTSLDVLLCTASILNLCTISVDRYLVITRPLQYAVKRTPSRMAAMVAAVWGLSAVISIPPLFGWEADNSDDRCMLSQAIGYQIYATVGAFYIPLAIMIFIYYQIYVVSSRIADAEARSKTGAAAGAGAGAGGRRGQHGRSTSADSGTPLNPKDGNCVVVVANSGRLRGILCDHGKDRDKGGSGGGGGGIALANLFPATTAASTCPEKRFRFLPQCRLNRMLSSKERKATKTLGVIMGAFTACWLPFFILALIKPFCADPETCIPHWLNSLFLWLGYTNSFTNPIIYARFNRDFRGPFRQILSCSCRGINSRMRSESYVDQYGGPPSSGGNADLHVRPSIDTVVRYQSQGMTIIRVHDDEKKQYRSDEDKNDL